MAMTATAARTMTTEELLAMPDDGVERYLIRGRLVEGTSVTRRNRRHSRAESTIAYLLSRWLASQPEPRGEVLTGEAGFHLHDNPPTTVGIDVAYISAQTARDNPDDAWLIEGSPVLAVEILSPSDEQEDILDKVREYLEAGVKLVWIVEPVFRTVMVYRPDAEPVSFNAQQELTGEPHLPGFRVPVAQIFG